MKIKETLRKAMGLCLLAAILLTAVGCGAQPAAETTVPAAEKETAAVETTAAVQETAPDKNDLSVVRSMELQYANNFSVDYCANGCKIITDGAGRKSLWVPEGNEVPDDTGDMQVLKAPFTNLGCFSTTHATLFNALDALDKIGVVTTAKEKWHIEQMVKQLDDGSTVFVGKSSAPDYELLSAAAPQLLLITSSTVSTPGEVLTKIDELGIPYIADSQHLENHPLGRIEWVKLVGALLDMEDEADAYFNEEVKQVEAVAAKAAQETEHPSVIQTFILRGTVYVRNGGDYVNEMLKLAGGDYPFAELEPDKGGNTKMTVEDFYKDAADADILIYDTTSDVKSTCVKDILVNGDYLADMKAIKEGNVWGIEKNYWQSADDVATMIEDLYTIMYHPENADQLHYFFKLPNE